MNWHRFVNDYQRKQEREEQEVECSERYKQFSRDVLQLKREEVEARLESLKHDFPDWEIQEQSLAYNEIRRLEKERECIILELVKRSESHASGKRKVPVAGCPPREPAHAGSARALKAGAGDDPEVAKRRSLVRANSDASAQEMCEIFDRMNVPLPSRWQGKGFASWEHAHNNSNYRKRIGVLISKDKHHS
jgi:hypothetical protein